MKARGKEAEAKALNIDDFAGKIEELGEKTQAEEIEEAAESTATADVQVKPEEAKAAINPEVKEGV